MRFPTLPQPRLLLLDFCFEDRVGAGLDREHPSGAKALVHFAALVARLKPCPCYKSPYSCGVMEKLKSWNALSNFCHNPGCYCWIFCFEDRVGAGLDQEHPSGAEAAIYLRALYGTTEVVPFLDISWLALTSRLARNSRDQSSSKRRCRGRYDGDGKEANPTLRAGSW